MALGLATLSGCSDFLDQNNKSNVPSAEFYQTSAGFASLTNSAYSTLRELYNAQPQLFVAGTDLYADGKSQGVVMSQYTFTADEGIIKNFYVSCFKGIHLKGIKRLWNRIPDGLIAGTSLPLCTGGIVGTLVAEWF